MNCQQAEQWLLLKDAGELPARNRLRLEDHLDGCASCRSYQDDLERVTAVVRRSLPAGAPAERALAAILETACTRKPVQRIPKWIRLVWRPALAAAALLMLCLGGWLWLVDCVPSTGGSAVAREQAVTKLVFTAVAGSDELSMLLMEDVLPLELVADLDLQFDLSPLDRDLLLLEGMAI